MAKKYHSLYTATALLQSYSLENLLQEGKEMKRKFTIHVGPTNSGKTFEALQRLKGAEKGQYLGPLRLLALEVFDTMNEAGVPCSLLTGEEYIETPGAKVVSSTIEMADFSTWHDVVVVDECQMIQDKDRGAHWLQAILTIPAEEVILCTAPECLTLLEKLLDEMEAQVEVVDHSRLAPLSYAGAFPNIREVQPGDALIVFARKRVLQIAAELESQGVKTSVIYGALPPQSRREEVRRFAAGETKVVVATDAIGMGISLPIRRIVFCQTDKFDGSNTRSLNAAEVQQIAGRAGRFGIYDEGYVLSMTGDSMVRRALASWIPDITQVVLPFPTEVLSSGEPMQNLLEAWNQLKDTELCRRVDMSVPKALYLRLLPYIPANTPRQDVYRLITCPLRPDDYQVSRYWLDCAVAILSRRPIPEPHISLADLESCERSYQLLDVQHQMGRRAGVEIDNMDVKKQVSDKINEFLATQKSDFLRRCSRCGKALPATSPYGMCEECYQKMRSHRYCSACGRILPDGWPYGRCDSCHTSITRWLEDEDEYEDDEEDEDMREGIAYLKEETGFTFADGVDWVCPEVSKDIPEQYLTWVDGKRVPEMGLLKRFELDVRYDLERCLPALFRRQLTYWAPEVRRYLDAGHDGRQEQWADFLMDRSLDDSTVLCLDVLRESLMDECRTILRRVVDAYFQRYDRDWRYLTSARLNPDGTYDPENFMPTIMDPFMEYLYDWEFPMCHDSPFLSSILKLAEEYRSGGLSTEEEYPPFVFLDHWTPDGGGPARG